MIKKLDKNYVSPIDLKLAEFDRNHGPSASQRTEIEKYERIAQLRSGSSSQPDATPKIWKDF